MIYSSDKESKFSIIMLYLNSIIIANVLIYFLNQ